MSGWALLLLCSTSLSDILHIMMDPSSDIPCIGGSGGVSGVIAFYALRYPHSRLSLMYLIFLRPVWVRIRAIWMFAIWFLLQLLVAYQQASGFGDVSGAAHLGGALTGFIFWILWRITKEPELDADQFAEEGLKEGKLRI